MAARVDLRMVNCPGNMAGLYRGRMECEACVPWLRLGEVAPICTQQHLTECRAYSFIRQEHQDIDINFTSQTRYLMDLMWIRA